MFLQIRVLAQDGGTPRLSSTATVYVGVERNQNRPFYGQQNYTVTVNEIQDLGVSILTLSAFDQDIQVIFNPIALRKAKIVYNFGLSECSRVNSTCSLCLGL